MDVHHNVNGVDALLRAGAVAAFAGDLDLKHIGGGHDGAHAVPDLAGGDHLAHVAVEAHGSIHMGIFQDAGLNHQKGAARAFLIGLEHEFDPATEFFPILHQQLGRAQQHGGMDIVATGVGRAGVLAFKGVVVLLIHGQGIHIRPQQDSLSRFSPFQYRYQAPFADGLRVIPHLPQPGLHKGAGHRQVGAQLWVLVQVLPPLGQLGQQRGCPLHGIMHTETSSQQLV